MNINNKIKLIVFGVLIFALAVTVAPRTFAREGTTEVDTSSTSETEQKRRAEKERETRLRNQENIDRQRTSERTTEPSEHQTAEREVEAETHRDGSDDEKKSLPPREKLAEQKRKVCEAHAEQINKVMDNVAKRTDTHMSNITNVYVLAKAFYVKHDLTVDNFDQLVAAVDTKKAAAESIAATLTKRSDFSCESDGPKTDIQEFKNQRLDKVNAVKAYRTAVKELVAAIRTAAAALSATNASEGGAN